MSTTSYPSMTVTDRAMVTAKWWPSRGRMYIARFQKAPGRSTDDELAIYPDSLVVRDGGSQLDYRTGDDVSLTAIDDRVLAVLRAEGYRPVQRPHDESERTRDDTGGCEVGA